MAKTLFLFLILREDQSLLHRPKLRKRMCLVDQLPFGSVLTPAISCTKFKVHSAHGDSPMAKTLFLFLILRGDQSLLYRPKLRKRMCLVDQLPCVSVLTPAISCTKFKVHSAHGDSPMAKTLFLFLILREDRCLLHRPKLRKRMCLVDQLPCGSVVTPAISCTKFKVHSAQADSPMAKTLLDF